MKDWRYLREHKFSTLVVVVVSIGRIVDSEKVDVVLLHHLVKEKLFLKGVDVVIIDGLM